MYGDRVTRKLYETEGLTYIETPLDQAIRDWYKKTNQSKYTREVITRLELVRAPNQKLYINWHKYLYREDAYHNEVPRFLPNVGQSYRPIALRGGRVVDNINTSVVNGIQGHDVIYNTLFTPENLDRLHENCIDMAITTPTVYAVKDENGTSVPVKSYEDLKGGNFDELFRLGFDPNVDNKTRSRKKTEKDYTKAEKDLIGRDESIAKRVNLSEFDMITNPLGIEAPTPAVEQKIQNRRNFVNIQDEIDKGKFEAGDSDIDTIITGGFDEENKDDNSNTGNKINIKGLDDNDNDNDNTLKEGIESNDDNIKSAGIGWDEDKSDQVNNNDKQEKPTKPSGSKTKGKNT